MARRAAERRRSPPRPARSWEGDEADWPVSHGMGSLGVLTERQEPEKGLYLPNGDWHPIPPPPLRRMGF